MTIATTLDERDEVVAEPWRFGYVDGLWRTVDRHQGYLTLYLGWAKYAIDLTAGIEDPEQRDRTGRRSLFPYVLRRVSGREPRHPHALWSYVLIGKHSRAIHGDASFWQTDRPGVYEMSLWVDNPRRGLGTSSATYINHLLFSTLKADRVELAVDPANTAMLALADRLGFASQGVVDRLQLGAPVPTVHHTHLFVMDADTWRRRQTQTNTRVRTDIRERVMFPDEIVARGQLALRDRERLTDVVAEVRAQSTRYNESPIEGRDGPSPQLRPGFPSLQETNPLRAAHETAIRIRSVLLGVAMRSIIFDAVEQTLNYNFRLHYAAPYHRFPMKATNRDATEEPFVTVGVPAYPQGSGRAELIDAVMYKMNAARVRFISEEKNWPLLRALTEAQQEWVKTGEACGVLEKRPDIYKAKRWAFEEPFGLESEYDHPSRDLLLSAALDNVDTAAQRAFIWPEVLKNASAVDGQWGFDRQQVSFLQCLHLDDVALSLRRAKFEAVYGTWPKAANPLKAEAISASIDPNDGKTHGSWRDKTLSEPRDPGGICAANSLLPGLSALERRGISRIASFEQLWCSGVRTALRLGDLFKMEPALAMRTGDALGWVVAMHAPLAWTYDPVANKLAAAKTGDVDRVPTLDKRMPAVFAARKAELTEAKSLC